MKAAGVIVEYNPFHNGHLYHLTETKRVTNADVTVAVMSGNFLQRGEPALIPKRERALLALQGGADIVVELPYAYAVQKAEVFAHGAVSLLKTMHVQDLCFGSEHGSIDDFLSTYHVLKNKKDQYDQRIQQAMQQGVSYPKAASEAFKEIQTNTNMIDLTKPNNILGFQYVKSIIELNASINPTTIKRTGAGYHDVKPDINGISSATGIRKMIDEGHLRETDSFVPNYTYECLLNYYKQYTLFHSWEQYFSLLKYKIVTTSPSALRQIYEVEEGLENRVREKIKYANTFKSFMEQLKTKRYTWTRLQRLCTHILTNTTKDDMAQALNKAEVPYIRLLGMTSSGQQYLRQIKKTLAYPVITKPTAFEHPMYSLDIRAATVHAMIHPESVRSNVIREEYSTAPIRLSPQETK